ncbi:hypothetical protein FH608_004420 [Nonomuraea phyllanthi]|uniref:WD40 repeat domain-containing protein n=1 Tax=Nonomuraea phyllanthi TaxID=2219224 RepID=A0A5C4WX36_9ACTN|nr:hypothetical protein [Nonomuraea phyllanthi]KAB8197773.1 hypothetical protein FH608_004420 [Nonomuraea phyllanthi]
MNKASDLPIFLANYGPSFARTAYLLTADQNRAHDLAVAALVAVGRRWSSVRWNDPVHAALRELYGRYLGVRGAPALGGHALAALPPKARAALVARFHDGLTAEQATAVTGLWTAVLDAEAHQAYTRLRTAHPELFADGLSAAEAPPAAGAQEGPADIHAPWAAPSGWAGAAPPASDRAGAGPAGAVSAGEQPPSAEPAGGQTAGAEPAGGQAANTEPTDTEPAGGQTPGGEAVSAPAAWAAPVQARDFVPAADEPGLRAALIRVAAEMSRTGLTEPVLSSLARRRRIRLATWTAVSLGTVGAFAALVVAGLSSIADTLDRMPATALDATPDQVPEPLPATLDDPIGSAYLGWCEGGGRARNSSDPRPCEQWRLVTTSGREWRLEGARSGYDETTFATLPLAISHDGHRLAYRDLKGSYVVRDLRTGTVRTIDLRHREALPHITSSPNGRYFALDFGAADSAVLDFDTGVTRHSAGREVRILAVGDDGTRVVSDERDVENVPGHASLTTLTVQRANGPAGRYRIDPDLIAYGAALSPDGRTLALVAEGERLVTMDARTGRVTGRRTAIDDYQVLAVERWLSADEVLVRQTDDEYAVLTKVDVRSGTSESADYEIEPLDYDSPIGALE